MAASEAMAFVRDRLAEERAAGRAAANEAIADLFNRIGGKAGVRALDPKSYRQLKADCFRLIWRASR
jgi:hypothetical protein